MVIAAQPRTDASKTSMSKSWALLLDLINMPQIEPEMHGAAAAVWR